VFRELTTLVSILLITTSMTACTGGSLAPSDKDETSSEGDTGSASTEVRVATFNASMYRERQGGLVDDLKGGDDEQARRVAEILQRVRPDVVLINEFDWDEDGEAAALFVEEYLTVGQGDAEPIEFENRFVPETNTGVHSGADLNKDGRTVSTPGSQAYGDDAFGFGQFPGQYGMLVLSRFPIAEQDIRRFRALKWDAMPDSLMPKDWYTEKAVDVMRLSSKNHIDVPIDVNGRRLHLLGSHPTPPSFDGPENRNERRNHDEIRFWRDYVSGSSQDAGYIADDSGDGGGLAAGESFVIAGDLNNDPKDGDGREAAIRGLLDHPRVQDPKPTSEGAVEAAAENGGANESQEGDPALDTTDFGDSDLGNVRLDYALPSADLTVESAGVFWPASDEMHADLVDASDHRLVWVDVVVE